MSESIHLNRGEAVGSLGNRSPGKLPRGSLGHLSFLVVLTRQIRLLSSRRGEEWEKKKKTLDSSFS